MGKENNPGPEVSGTNQGTSSSSTSGSSTTTIDPTIMGFRNNLLLGAQQFAETPARFSGALAAPLSAPGAAAQVLGSLFATSPQAFGAQPLAQTGAQLAMSPAVLGAGANSLDTLQGFTTAQAQDPTSNPFLVAAMNAANDQTVRQLQENVLPQIRLNAIGSGQFGGSRGQLAEGVAARGAAEDISNQNLSLAAQQFNTNANRALTAAQSLPGAAQGTIAPLAAGQALQGEANRQTIQNLAFLDSLGVRLEGVANDQIRASFQRWLAENNFDLQRMQLLGNVVASSPRNTQTQFEQQSTGESSYAFTQLGQGTQSSPLSGALGGAAAGAGVGGQIGGAAGAGVGAGIGALIGLLGI